MVWDLRTLRQKNAEASTPAARGEPATTPSQVTFEVDYLDGNPPNRIEFIWFANRELAEAAIEYANGMLEARDDMNTTRCRYYLSDCRPPKPSACDRSPAALWEALQATYEEVNQID